MISVQQWPVLLVILFVALAANALAWRFGYYHYSTRAHNFNPRQLSGWDVTGAFFLFFGISLILIPGWVALALYLYQKDIAPAAGPFWLEWFNVLLIVALAVAFVLYVAAMKATKRSELFRKGGNPRDALVVGSISWLISYPTVMIIGQLIAIVVHYMTQITVVEQLPVQHLKKIMEQPTLFYVTAAAIIFVVPIVEEVLFRGFLQTWLRRYLSVNGAIIASSCVFALCHFSVEQGIANIELVITLFLLSLFLGFSFERQQSLLAPIALHTIFNAMSVLLIFQQNINQLAV